jgi:hypothetical protein
LAYYQRLHPIHTGRPNAPLLLLGPAGQAPLPTAEKPCPGRPTARRPEFVVWPVTIHVHGGKHVRKLNPILLIAVAALTASSLTGSTGGRFPAACFLGGVPLPVTGSIEIDYAAPTTVVPGQTFRITVNNLAGSVLLPIGAVNGDLSVRGPVDGPRLLSPRWAEYPPRVPFHYDLTVTGQPGQIIELHTVRASSLADPQGSGGLLTQQCYADIILRQIRIV